MAIYRCEFKIYGRTGAGSAVAASAYVTGTKQSQRGGNAGSAKTVSAVEAAAYRASASLHNDLTGETHDFSRKEHVAWSGILAPDNAPAWVYDRGKPSKAGSGAPPRGLARLTRRADGDRQLHEGWAKALSSRNRSEAMNVRPTTSGFRHG
jgi:hypothetical protein